MIGENGRIPMSSVPLVGQKIDPATTLYPVYFQILSAMAPGSEYQDGSELCDRALSLAITAWAKLGLNFTIETKHG